MLSALGSFIGTVCPADRVAQPRPFSFIGFQEIVRLGGGLLSAFAPTRDREEVAPTQTPSAPMRSEEGHRAGASRRAILSRDGRTPTRRRPSRREMRTCGASFRKRPHRPGVAQAVANRVNYPRGLLQLLQFLANHIKNNSNSHPRNSHDKYANAHHAIEKPRAQPPTHFNQCELFSF